MKSTTAPKTRPEKLIKSSNLFPVVGIGASAGGLDAFKRLLKAIPRNSGMAYVLVQHLDPNHESMLPELLQKVTTIPVLEIADDIKVERDHIYVIPSNKMMVATDGVLLLAPRPAKNKNERNLPIDLFFTSLAEVHQTHAIGVVLSGTASDGTLGLKAIKDHGGITFAQDEESAAYEGMPHSAAQAGVVDFILPPESIPQKLLEVTSIIIGNADDEQNISQQDEEVFKQMLSLLRIRKGTDFTYYKQTTLRRRILRRMALNKNEEPAAYLKYLREDKPEQDVLYQDLLIPVTAFFRDHKSFDNLCEIVFPLIVKNKTPGEPIRIWVAGCSTGEEAYSIAMCFKEFLSNNQRVQIFATDLSESAIAKARIGIYTKSEMDAVPPQRLQEFFTKTNGSYRVNKQVRDMCVFAIHDFLKDPPFGKMDFISCRNVLIYMEPYLQKKALTTFHYSLNPKGFLLLGKTETISGVPDLFAAAAKNDKLFSRKDVPGRFMHVASQRSEQHFSRTDASANNETIRTDFQKTADDIMLSRYTPAGVVVNEAMDIVHFRGTTGYYLEQSPGKPSHNLLQMAKNGLAFELRNILHKAKKDKTPVIKEHIPLEVNGSLRNISIEAIPLPNIIEPHYLILFHDNAGVQNPKPEIRNSKPSSKLKKDDKGLRIQQLEQELAQAREDMRSITEDQEAANEELQSANEELLSGSEELQSLNEELETGKEELQSTNEELTVVNQEMISLNEQVTTARDYAEAIIVNIREPLLVLDKDLRIKTANNTFYKTFRLNEPETEGVLIYDLGNKQWNIPALRTMLETILPEKSILNDFEVTHTFSTIGERVMLLNACEVINKNGSEKLILLSIEDITERKKAQEVLRKTGEHFRELVKGLPAGVYSCDAQGKINFFNDAAIKIWGREPEIGTEFWCGSYKIFKSDGSPLPLDSCPMATAIKEGHAIMGEEIIIERPDGSRSNVLVHPQPEFGLSGEIIGAINMVIDITEIKKAEFVLRQSEEHFREMAELMPQKVWTADAEGNLNYFNKCWFEYTGLTFEELKDWGWKNIIHPDEWEENKKRWQHSIDTGVNFEMEHRFRNTEGKYKWHLSRGLAQQNENGKTKMWIGTNTEIEEQKKQKEELKKAVVKRTYELQEANKELAFQSIEKEKRAAELIITNKELEQQNQEIAISKYNKRFLTEFSERFSSYKPHDEFFNSLVLYIADLTKIDYVLVGKTQQSGKDELAIQTIAITAFGKLAENINYPMPDGPCEQVIQGNVYSYPENCRITFPKNQTLVQFNVEGYIGYPLFDADGKAIGLIAVMHEKRIDDAETVTAILKIVAKRAEIELDRIKYEEALEQNNKTLEKQNDELEKINKELESFTYVSSHDLQEPLRKIQTFAGRILEKENQNLSDNGKDYFHRIQQAAHRMQTLIADLLAFSRINTAERKFETTDLNIIIEEVKTEFKEAIEEKHATIEATELCPANIIAFQFRQLMHNLISNALKFSTPDIPSHIIIKSRIVKGSKLNNENPALPADRLSPEKTYCHITVKDNGIGFEPEYNEKIFEVFQKLHGKEEYAGTGIGLAIVKKIVGNHNGIITATSQLNKGATFDIYIPSN